MNADGSEIEYLQSEVVRLYAEVGRLRNAVTFADQQGAEAIERVSSEIVADKWNATAVFQARALKAEAERDELRLTLEAEQGRRIDGVVAGANMDTGFITIEVEPSAVSGTRIRQRAIVVLLAVDKAGSPS